MTILFLNGDGGGCMTRIEVPEGANVADVVRQEMKIETKEGLAPYLVGVRRGTGPRLGVPYDFVLQHEDRLTVLPNKSLEGAHGEIR